MQLLQLLKIKDKTKINLVKKLSECSGHLGIAGGQYLDLSYEKKKISKNKIIEMEKKRQESYSVFAVRHLQSLKIKAIKKSNFLKI